MQNNVNTVLLRSIPLDKAMKRYFVAKWNHLIKHNGESYASEIFKNLRTALIAYRADPNRIDNYDMHLSALPVRKNGWAKKLLAYTDSHPHLVFNFLKLYTSFPEPLTTVDEAARQMHDSLSSNDVNQDVPWFLEEWLAHFVESGKPLDPSEFHLIKDALRSGYQSLDSISRRYWHNVPLRLLERFVHHHSYSQYLRYWYTWNKRFRSVKITVEQSLHHMSERYPYPDVYKDFDGVSKSADADLKQFALWAKANGVGGYGFDDCVVDLDDLNLMMQTIDSRLLVNTIHQLSRHSWMEDLQYPHNPLSYVGQIHHIPKKGTTDRRSIAVPNRYVQNALNPGYRYLEAFVRRLEKNDATFNQDRFDVKIQNRVNNRDLYIGSVDLSKATDNLPFSWGRRILEALPEANAIIDQSLQLFSKITTKSWANGPFLSEWTCGQPLGTLPSFMLLSLTHNLYLESLSFSRGLVHSPYAVLGDDVVIFSKKIRRGYIRDLSNRRIPLSLHKSFEGNLTEFAGKTYVRNMRAFYTPDHSSLSWNSLFDWQRASGISIPWNHLPKEIRKKIERMVETSNLPRGVCPLVWDIGLRANVFVRGSSVMNDDSYLDTYFYLLEDADQDVAKETFSGLSRLGGHPIQLGDIKFAEKNGYFQRYQEVRPDWFATKYRPVETDKILHTAIKTVEVVKGYQ